MARIWTELKDEDLQEVSGGIYIDLGRKPLSL